LELLSISARQPFRDTPADGQTLSKLAHECGDDGGDNPCVEQVTGGQGDGHVKNMQIPVAKWTNIVAVTIHGSGYYPSRSTFHIALNPGHFTGALADDVMNPGGGVNHRDGGVLWEVEVHGHDGFRGKNTRPEFELRVRFGYDLEDRAPVRWLTTIPFNGPDCGEPELAGGCDSEFTKKARCEKKPSWAAGGKYGEDIKCGAVPLNDVSQCDEEGDEECEAPAIEALENNCRECCEEVAMGAQEQGCCQFNWYYRQPSLCMWKPGGGVGAPAEGQTAPRQQSAVLCNCKNGVCNEDNGGYSGGYSKKSRGY